MRLCCCLKQMASSVFDIGMVVAFSEYLIASANAHSCVKFLSLYLSNLQSDPQHLGFCSDVWICIGAAGESEAGDILCSDFTQENGCTCCRKLEFLKVLRDKKHSSFAGQKTGTQNWSACWFNIEITLFSVMRQKTAGQKTVLFLGQKTLTRILKKNWSV